MGQQSKCTYDSGKYFLVEIKLLLTLLGMKLFNLNMFFSYMCRGKTQIYYAQKCKP